MMFVSEKVLSLQSNLLVSRLKLRLFVLGLTGFDGEMRWYVSTRRLEGSLHNLSSRKINWQQ